MRRPPLHHLRILASAGSGKTFRLSGRFIDLLERGADPTTILASTFTRAASAEIRDRILGRLAKAALEGKDEAAGLALERVVRDLDRLEVRTLDSLFAATVMAFAPEFGLAPEPRLLDEFAIELAKAEAIERMLAADDAGQLLATVAALNKGQARLSMQDAIGRAVEGAVAILRESTAEAWEWGDAPVADAETVRKLLDRMARLAAALSGRVQTAMQKDLAALAEAGPHDAEAWAERVGTGLANAVLAKGGVYYKSPLPDPVVDLYVEVIEHARALSRAETVRRTRATREVARRYAEAFDQVKGEAGAVTFDDLTRVIADAAGDPARAPSLEEVFFRLDSRIHHALLDEFQDTSVAQWRALGPIVREIAAGDPGERSLFVVGDLKQSIYGWRGASPALLERLPDFLLEERPAEIVDERLATSYRTAQVVLDHVDQVFGGIESNPALGAADVAVIDAATAWKSAWSPHRAAHAMPGTVELHLAPAAGRSAVSREQQESTMDAAADLVRELRTASPGISIGVLCRRNKAVAGLLNRLRARGVPASARGVGSLQDAASVNAMLDALVLADHPDHTAAAFHVGHSPLGPLVGLGPDDHRRERARHRHAVAKAIRASLDVHGYADCLRRWRDGLLDAVDAREGRRLEELIARAAEFDLPDDGSGPPRRPATVVAALRAVELDEIGEASTVVMNMHQSKGLEFDAVVLCDLDRPYVTRTSLAATRSRPDGPYTRVARWPSGPARHPDFDEIVARAVEADYREFLSTLYVALTRARRGLFAVCAPPSAKGATSPPNSFAGILRAAWCSSLDASGPGAVYAAGKRSALVAEKPAAPTAAATAAAPIALDPPSGRRATRAASASEREAPTATSGPLVSAASVEARARGIAIHGMLETVGWSADGLPSLEELAAAGRRALARALARADRGWLAEQARWLLGRLGQPAIAAVFGGGANDRLHREWTFARLAGEGVERGAIDRLVLRGEPVRGATIIDFKTDRGGDVEGLVATYRPQVEAYRVAVAERFGLAPTAVEARLVFLEHGRVAAV